MKNLKKYSIVLSLAVIMGACDQYKLPEIEQPTAGSGGLDVTKMVSIGNSLTAGYMNGALYTDGQNNSFPSIIAAQMKLVGGGDFNQPTINSVNGYYGTSGGALLGRLYLKGTTSPKPTPKIPGELPTPFTGNKATLNNFGVPGITIGTAQLPDLGNPNSPYYNGLYARFASSPGVSTVLKDAAAALANGGTFFTFWLGNNDVLGYATNGADQNDPTRPLTSNTAFDAYYAAGVKTILDAKTGTKGAVANIPDVTGIPYFSLVPYNALPVPLPNGTTATILNGAFAGYNGALDGLVAYANAFGISAALVAEIGTRKVSFVTGANKLLIKDETLTDLGPYFDGLKNAGAITQSQRDALVPYQQVRQTTSKDLVTLPTASVIGTTGTFGALGISEPLPDKYVLIPTEITEIQASVTHFNATIASVVTANSDRLVLVDANKILSDLKKTPVLINGSSLSSSIVPPFGAFSTDGVHPNARGYAFVANKFIEAINAKWGSTIPLCNPNNYSGNELPTP